MELVVLLVLLVSCSSLRSVSLPHNAGGLSVIMAFLVILLYSLVFLVTYTCCVYIQTFPNALFVKATV